MTVIRKNAFYLFAIALLAGMLGLLFSSGDAPLDSEQKALDNAMQALKKTLNADRGSVEKETDTASQSVAQISVISTDRFIGVSGEVAYDAGKKHLYLALELAGKSFNSDQSWQLIARPINGKKITIAAFSPSSLQPQRNVLRFDADLPQFFAIEIFEGDNPVMVAMP